mmetsp:Transcript_29833/g.43802  ORF Transcript_29833/g.43802 Transcript_29833/m.43802 type:complete len:95 (+) Transcript_29833:1398-1682(+)
MCLHLMLRKPLRDCGEELLMGGKWRLYIFLKKSFRKEIIPTDKFLTVNRVVIHLNRCVFFNCSGKIDLASHVLITDFSALKSLSVKFISFFLQS